MPPAPIFPLIGYGPTCVGQSSAGISLGGGGTGACASVFWSHEGQSDESSAGAKDSLGDGVSAGSDAAASTATGSARAASLKSDSVAMTVPPKRVEALRVCRGE